VPPLNQNSHYDTYQIKLEGCIVWNATIQCSTEVVRYPCTSCLLSAEL